MSVNLPDGAPPEDWLVAHRGYPMRYPENSLIGMRAVLEAGARFVEFDVQISADGHPVVAHDDSLKRVAGSTGKITRLNLVELEAVAIGESKRFGDTFRDARIPTLADMLHLIDDYPGVTVFVEIKGESLDRFGREEMMDAVMKVMAPVHSHWVALSFDAEAMAMARARGAPEIGWVFRRWSRASKAMAESLKPDYLFNSVARTPAGDAPFWPGPWRWAIYGINDLRLALETRARGAHLIETDCLPELASAWRNRSLP
jgi:glycerophosphoryl diester phosphodiesterase